MSFVQVFRRNKPWLDLAKKVLEELYRSREGGVLSKAMAGVSITNMVIDTAFPEDRKDTYLESRGFQLYREPARGFLCDIIQASGPPTTLMMLSLIESLSFWVTDEGALCIYKIEDRFEEGPYVLNGDFEYLLDVVFGNVWGPNSDLLLTCLESYKYYHRCAGKYEYSPIPDPGSYLSDPKDKGSAEYWATRLSSYGSDPRTLLIKGPTGVGKSVLARQIARLTSDGNARTLKISKAVIKFSSTNELTSLVTALRPSVLLLDDVDFEYVDLFLDVLERLRVEDCLVLLTQMMDTSKDEGNRGEGYVEGLRPERIDEVCVLRFPSAPLRDSILRDYYVKFRMIPPDRKTQEDIVEATADLTGAYLKEVARRLKVFGIERWREEVDNVLYMAPPLASEEEGSEEEEGKSKTQKFKSKKKLKKKTKCKPISVSSFEKNDESTPED